METGIAVIKKTNHLAKQRQTPTHGGWYLTSVPTAIFPVEARPSPVLTTIKSDASDLGRDCS